MKRNCHSDNGYVLLEVIISIFITFFVISSAVSIFGVVALQYNKSIATKELIESSDYIEQVFINEFSKSSDIKNLLDINGNELTEIPRDKEVVFKCLGLIRSQYIFYQSGYTEEFIYGGEFLNYTKKPVFISKYKKSEYGAKDYKCFSGFEVGNNVKQMGICKVDDFCYIINITLGYRDTEIIYNKKFLAKLKGV